MKSYRTMLRSRWPAVVLVAFVAVLLLALARPSTANDPRVLACGPSPSNTVTAAFDMASARDYRAHFPQMVAKPELDNDDSPVFVVVISGPIDIPLMHAAGSPKRTYTNAVCVFKGQEPTIYVDEDLTGFKP
jgi:hypothetical protein